MAFLSLKQEFEADIHLYICPVSQCQNFLENPINLPCGNTICKKHIDQLEGTSYDCQYCLDKHQVPENGFPINYIASQSLNLNKHLNGEFKETKQVFDRIVLMIEKHKHNCLVDADTFIYDKFSKLRNQIDLHREQMIEAIIERSDEMLSALNQLEQECKNNRSTVSDLQMIKLDENLLKIKNSLYSPKLRTEELIELRVQLDSKLNEAEDFINKFESELLMNQEITFIPYFNPDLGDLKVVKQADIFTKHGKSGKFAGQMFNQQFHGFGYYSFNDGQQFFGEFLNNQQHGHCTYSYPDGSKYVGQYVEGKRNGFGVYYFNTNDDFKDNRYQGQFSNDAMNGRGTLFFSNGNKYVGDFVKNRRSGRGIFYYANGDRFEGEFLNNQKHGLGTMFYCADGYVQTGIWIRDKFEPSSN
jgi:hypothetical protein